MPFGYSKKGYGAVAKESSPGVPVKPTNYFKYESESLSTGFKSESLGLVENTRNMNPTVVDGTNDAPTGQLSMPIQANPSIYFLAAAFGEPTPAVVETSLAWKWVFTSSDSADIPTLTIDIGNTDFGTARRYCGVRNGSVKWLQKNNVWYMEVTPMARYSFITAEVTAAAIATDTALILDTTHGLTTADTIIAGLGSAHEEELTISAVNVNGTTLTTSAMAHPHSVGEIIAIKASTPSYDTSTLGFAWIGGTTTKIGATLGTAAEMQLFEDFSVDMSQGLEPFHAAAGDSEFARYPQDVFVKGYGAKATTKFPSKNLTYQNYLRTRTDLAFDLSATGRFVEGSTATKDKIEVEVSKFRMDPYALNNTGDEIIRENISGMCQVSDDDGFDVRFSITNGIGTL